MQPRSNDPRNRNRAYAPEAPGRSQGRLCTCEMGGSEHCVTAYERRSPAPAPGQWQRVVGARGSTDTNTPLRHHAYAWVCTCNTMQQRAQRAAPQAGHRRPPPPGDVGPVLTSEGVVVVVLLSRPSRNVIFTGLEAARAARMVHQLDLPSCNDLQVAQRCDQGV